MFKRLIQWKSKNILKIVEKKIHKFSAIDAVSFYSALSNMINLLFVPVVCVLYDVLKNSRFPVWNDVQFCLNVRQAERGKKSFTPSLCMYE